MVTNCEQCFNLQNYVTLKRTLTKSLEFARIEFRACIYKGERVLRRDGLSSPAHTMPCQGLLPQACQLQYFSFKKLKLV